MLCLDVFGHTVLARRLIVTQVTRDRFLTGMSHVMPAEILLISPDNFRADWTRMCPKSNG